MWPQRFATAVNHQELPRRSEMRSDLQYQPLLRTAVKTLHWHESPPLGHTYAIA